MIARQSLRIAFEKWLNAPEAFPILSKGLNRNRTVGENKSNFPYWYRVTRGKETLLTKRRQTLGVAFGKPIVPP